MSLIRYRYIEKANI